MSNSTKAWSPSDVEAFIASYNSGSTDSQLADEFDGTRDKVQKFVARLKGEGRVLPRGQLAYVDDRTWPILQSHGIDPNEFEPDTVWAKTDEASVLLRRKATDWQALIDSLADRAPHYPKLQRPLRSKTGRMLEPALYDLHLGKYAWAEEVGENYDLDIACERYRAALKDLLGRFVGETFDEVVLVWGQDLSHIDNRQGTTTKGTPLDYDTRFEKIVRSAIELGIETIEACLTFGPVKVISIPGNHGRHTDFMICLVLSAYFRNCPDVTFDLSPKSRKYHKFGSVGLGFTHGDGFKPDKLPILFAAEEPEIWGATKHREFHHGHLHHKVTTEFPGCNVRQLPSLSGTDAWHYNNGFTGMKKEAKAFVWHKDNGLEAEYSTYA